MKLTPNSRMGLIAGVIFFLDQLTKQIVLKKMGREDEVIVIDGFFKLVNWPNTGAAWSMFHNRNAELAIVSLVALLALFIFRRHFEIGTPAGQVSLGLIFGGILGNLYDRLFVGHVVDFIRFYMHQRGGREIGFPAFNIADTAICVGVGLLFILSWRLERASRREEQAPKPS
jgi:signal peptidase II